MEKDIKTLQLFYASVLADSVYHYAHSGILNLVCETKRKQQKLTAPTQIKQLGIQNPKELFIYFSRVFGCIKWVVSETEEGFMARGKHCLLCHLTKRRQTSQPCHIYCINPFRELLKAMHPSYKLSVESTLWESDACVFKVSQLKE
jgi:hypothetical protein